MQDRASDFKFLNFLGFHYLHRNPFPSYINLVVIVVSIDTARKKDLFTGGHFGGVTDLVRVLGEYVVDTAQYSNGYKTQP